MLRNGNMRDGSYFPFTKRVATVRGIAANIDPAHQDRLILREASLVPGLSDGFKVAIVAGAVTGGGLTVIANAPNPAGVAILKGKFDEGVVDAGKLLLPALPPTVVAAMAFKFL
jgi:Ethanolamine utilization protein EutJ (predicted chaperonin)